MKLVKGKAIPLQALTGKYENWLNAGPLKKPQNQNCGCWRQICKAEGSGPYKKWRCNRIHKNVRQSGLNVEIQNRLVSECWKNVKKSDLRYYKIYTLRGLMNRTRTLSRHVGHWGRSGPTSCLTPWLLDDDDDNNNINNKIGNLLVKKARFSSWQRET
jgi:hypothetical protein